MLDSPALLARLELLPAEKMLASIDPGYQALEVAARLDTHLVNGHLHFVQYNADSPTGAGYADALADLFLRYPAGEGIPQEVYPDARRQPQAPAAGAAEIVQAVRRHSKKPNIAIVEFRSRLPLRPERISIFPRFLPRRRLRRGDRLAGATGISQRRPAQGLVRDRPGVPPPGRAGIPAALRPDAIRWCRHIAIARSAWSTASAPNWPTRRPCSAC